MDERIQKIMDFYKQNGFIECLAGAGVKLDRSLGDISYFQEVLLEMEPELYSEGDPTICIVTKNGGAFTVFDLNSGAKKYSETFEFDEGWDEAKNQEGLSDLIQMISVAYGVNYSQPSLPSP